LESKAVAPSCPFFLVVGQQANGNHETATQSLKLAISLTLHLLQVSYLTMISLLAIQVLLII
jgi:hypothetical protein